MIKGKMHTGCHLRDGGGRKDENRKSQIIKF